jgi:tRNA N6-adenosine threonylcarbamoyltransferase
LKISTTEPGYILGIETSCDETAAAVLSMKGELRANVVASQHEVHRRFGGVVPELASRKHTEQIEGIVQEAIQLSQIKLSEVKAVAVTQGPGLAGALLVGVSFGKALAYAQGIPWVAVNHLEGHVASAWLQQPDFQTPCVILVVSGGHTHLYLVPRFQEYQLIGRTLDDAAGEAFDKGAKMLGLDYPGGPALDRLARSGNAQAVRFPRPYLNRGGLNFSFSGLKTSLLYYLRDLKKNAQECVIADVAAGYQEAIVEVLVEKTFRAIRRHKVGTVAVVGGVSANSRLRAWLADRAADSGVQLIVPRLELCTDNAAMIAAAGLWAYSRGEFACWDIDAKANLQTQAFQAIKPNHQKVVNQ